MNNLLQKALAGWLSVVIACGAGVPALAARRTSFGSGSVSGKVYSNEGPMPEKLVEIEMPTRREDMFDFILDPSGAIVSSGAARYKDQYGEDVTFDSGKLFFQNLSVDENGVRHVRYSNRSDSLIVTNVGNVPLDVEVTLEVRKGGYDFEFASAPDFTNKDGLVIPGASMYMALVSEKRESPVEPVTVEGVEKYCASITSWLAPPEDAHKIVWDAEKDAYRYQLKDNVPESAFDSTSFYVTGALGEGIWDGVDETISMDISWNVNCKESQSAEKPEEYETPESAPKLQSVTYAYRKGETAKVLVDFGSGEEAKEILKGISYTLENGTTGFVKASAMTVTPYPSDEYQFMLEVTVSGKMFDAVEWAVQLANEAGETIDLPLQLVLDIMKPTATVINRASTIGGQTEIRVNWGIMDAVSAIAYTTLDGDSAEIPASDIDAASAENTIYVTLNESAAKGSDFTLILTNGDGDTAEFALDLSNYGEDPSVQITRRATASAPSADLLIDWGVAAKAMDDVSQIKYINVSGNPDKIPAENITRNGDTVSIRFDADSIRGTDFELILINSKKGTPFNVTFAEDALIEPIYPTVTVTQTATSDRPSAVIRVDWGAGSEAMETVRKVTYDKSGGTGEITGDNISIDGDTVSVQFDAASLAGYNFKLEMANGHGGHYTVAATLTNEINPDVIAVTSASAVGDFAAMTVNWGTGSKASSFNKVTYTDISGQTAEVDDDDITIIGDAISIRLNESSVKGSDFKLILSNNINGELIEKSVALVDSVDPSVTAVTQKANAAGESATLTVNWGSGEKAMSSVKEVTYTNVSGQAATITGSNITVNGNTVSVKFDATSIKGTGFKLVLARGNQLFTIDNALELVTSANPTATVTQTASASGQSAKITVNWGVGSKAMSSVDKVTYTDISGQPAEITGSNITVSDDTVSVKFDADSIRGAHFRLVLKNAGNATFEIPADLDLVDAADPTVTVTSKASASGQSAKITVNWGAGSKAMNGVSKVTYTNASGASATIAASVNGNTISIPFNADSIRGTDFKLVLENGRSANATFTAPVDLVNAVDPTVTVTSKATAAGQSSTMTVNWGAGSKAMNSVSKLTYTNASGASATIAKSNITVNDDTISVQFDATSIKGNNFKLTLSRYGGATFEIAVNLSAYEEPPTATVTKKAKASGQSAVMTVTWGVGSKAMTSVSKVTYTNASGASAEITGTDNIKVEGNTVSVKFTNASIQGSDFKLVLTNGKGKTCELLVDLADFDPSLGVGAEATVTKQATSSSKTATIIVDWGSGDMAMTSVSKITYHKPSGASAEIPLGSSLLVSGNVVTVKFTNATIKGTDFVLVLKNNKGGTLEIPVDLVES